MNLENVTKLVDSRNKMRSDETKENMPTKLSFGGKNGFVGDNKRNSSRSKLGSLSVNVLNSVPFSSGSGNYPNLNFGFNRANVNDELTKLKPRNQTNPDQYIGSYLQGNGSFGAISDTITPMSFPEEVPDFPDFVSAVPKCDMIDDLSLSHQLPPLQFDFPVPMSPPLCSPYLPSNYPVFIPPPSVSSLTSLSVPSEVNQGLTATVEQEGFIRLRLNHDMVLDICINMAVRLMNMSKQSYITLSASTKHAAIIHPKGRILVYEPRVEIQTEDSMSVKNAKVYPRGISFTANNMALVYLLDEAGARSTSDMFHDLYATHIVDTLFEESCSKAKDESIIERSIFQLDSAQYWRTEKNVDCWIFGCLHIQQTYDGLVIIERTLEDKSKISIKSSPSNGKIRLDSDFVQVTASLGDDSHMFLRSKDRRLHYNGGSGVFMVRNAGHSAGFDEEGELRIF